MPDFIVISRRDAHARGLKRFYTGDPCARGHYSERFTSSGACIACQVFKTPNKRKGPKGNNVGWPTRGLVFRSLDPLPEEMEAAFHYIEANGWHDAALQAVRNDPALLAKYVTPLSAQEEGRMHVALDRQRRVLAAIRGEDK